MYTFKPATDRIKHMRQLIRDRVIRKDAWTLAAFSEADAKYKDVMPIIKKGLVTLDVVKTMKPEIEDFELIVGSAGKYFCGSTVNPTYHGIGFCLNSVKSREWTMREDGLYHTPETDEIVRSLLQAFMLSILSLMRQHQTTVIDIDRTATRGNRQLFERFMEALSHYHQQERMVQFYADKLCVTPKYLSTVVKEYSGKSPSDWICEYVIAEAKSLLHYSQMSVQEVAFHLNFPTQSAFGKFFKQKTGFSPRQYVKGASGE